MDDLREALRAGLTAGTLLEAVHTCARGGRNQRDAVALELASLHNESEVDVIGVFAGLRIEPGNDAAFFSLRHVFDKALPRLDSPVLPAMHCVLKLCGEAGHDLMAGSTLQSFVEFCAKVPSRSGDALREIEANPADFAGLLTATLVGGSRVDHEAYLRETLRLCEAENVELRRGAAQALGLLNSPAGVTTDEAFAALERLAAKEADDRVLAGIVRSAFALLRRDPAQTDRVVAPIRGALAKGDDYALHAASEIFGLHTDEVPASLLELLRAELSRVKPANGATLENIDLGISQLIERGDPNEGLPLLEGLLIAHRPALKLEMFKSTRAAIHGSQALLRTLLTRWFLNGDPALCAGLESISAAHHGQNLKLEIDPGQLPKWDRMHALFVARKAIGWLFFQPVTAASLLISLMRHAADEKTLQELGALLFNPVLLNFTGSACEYVREQAQQESGKVRETIERALKAIDDYLDVLRSIGTLPALQPSESQREAHHRHFSEIMAASWKEAEAQSPLLHLFPKNVLLYGRKSIDYVYGGEGQPRRLETELKGFETQIETPRMEQIDSFGLIHMLETFKRERLRP